MVQYGGGRPAYRQIADTLRHRIETGELGPGARLPSSHDLARQYKVSRVVGQMAVDVLKREGLVLAHPGKGVFVREPLSARYLQADRSDPVTAPVSDTAGDLTWTSTTELATADPILAGRLGVSVGEQVTVTRYVGKAAGGNVQMLTSWEPVRRVPGTPVPPPAAGAIRGVVARYAAIGITVDRIDGEVAARMPTELEQRVLRVAPAVPVLVIERTHRAGGVIIETADLVVAGDRYRFRSTPQGSA